MMVVAGRGLGGGFRQRGSVGGFMVGRVEVMGCVVVWVDFNKCDFGGQQRGQWMQWHRFGGAATWAVGAAAWIQWCNSVGRWLCSLDLMGGDWKVLGGLASGCVDGWVDLGLGGGSVVDGQVEFLC